MASKVAVPISCPSLNPCRVLLKMKLRFKRQFTTDDHTLHATSTSPIPQYYPFHFGMRTIIFHESSSVRVPSPNDRLTSLTTSYHCLHTGSLLCIASCIYPFKYYALVPYGAPTLPPFRPCTATAISASVGTPSSISAGRTRRGTPRTSGGIHLSHLLLGMYALTT